MVADSIYDQVLPEAYTDSAMPVNCKVAAGRDESDFYEAMGVVCEGPVTFGTATNSTASFTTAIRVASGFARFPAMIPPERRTGSSGPSQHLRSTPLLSPLPCSWHQRKPSLAVLFRISARSLFLTSVTACAVPCSG